MNPGNSQCSIMKHPSSTRAWFFFRQNCIHLFAKHVQKNLHSDTYFVFMSFRSHLSLPLSSHHLLFLQYYILIVYTSFWCFVYCSLIINLHKVSCFFSPHFLSTPPPILNGNFFEMNRREIPKTYEKRYNFIFCWILMPWGNSSTTS